MAIQAKANPNNVIKVRVGQRNVTKVIASNKSAGAEISGPLVTIANDVLATGRATNTFLMYDGTNYIHVDAAQILDLADTVDDDTIDYGSF